MRTLARSAARGLLDRVQCTGRNVFTASWFYGAEIGGVTKSQKEKAAGRELHKEKMRAKKQQRKQRKNTTLPTRHSK